VQGVVGQIGEVVALSVPPVRVSRRGVVALLQGQVGEFGLAPDHVVYAGTAGKTLAPGLRLGWLLVPDGLVADVAAAKVTDDRGSPVLDQLAFADFVAHGEFDRHLRRMRPRYRRLRDTLIGTLAQRLPGLRPTGVSACTC
jgi:GntR family transcriptional regulator/MocR family aminotransferase